MKKLYKVTARRITDVSAEIELSDEELKELQSITSSWEFENRLYEVVVNEQDAEFEENWGNGSEFIDIDLETTPLSEEE